MKTAVISECGRYRYSLHRILDQESPNRVLFIMLNPSTADHEVDDPTIRRCIGFAKRMDYGFLEVANCYAFRATDPKELYKEIENFGDLNADSLRESIHRADLVICAWGDNWVDPKIKLLIGACIKMANLEAYCLGGPTKKGNPRHPLYLKRDAPLLKYQINANLKLEFKGPT